MRRIFSVQSDGPKGHGAGPEAGCSSSLIAAAAIGLLAALAMSFSTAWQQSLLALVVAILVYLGGAFALVLITANTALAAYSRWLVVALVPFPAAVAVWFVLRLLEL